MRVERTREDHFEDHRAERPHVRSASECSRRLLPLPGENRLRRRVLRLGPLRRRPLSSPSGRRAQVEQLPRVFGGEPEDSVGCQVSYLPVELVQICEGLENLQHRRQSLERSIERMREHLAQGTLLLGERSARASKPLVECVVAPLEHQERQVVRRRADGLDPPSTERGHPPTGFPSDDATDLQTASEVFDL